MNMQNLIVICIVILSIGILYRYGAPYAIKYRTRHCLFKLFKWLKLDVLAKKMNPERFKKDWSACCDCNQCPPVQKENIHPVHIVRKMDMDK